MSSSATKEESRSSRRHYAISGKVRLQTTATKNFKARLSEIPAATTFLLDTLKNAVEGAIDDTVLFDLRLALTESFANVVEHSYCHEPNQLLCIRIITDRGRVEIHFEDRGRRPQLGRLKWRDLNDYRERGLGLFLISRCMDLMYFRFIKDGVNRLVISRFLDGDSSIRKSQIHLPFHIAAFEEKDVLRICPVGHLDRTRPDPFSSIEVAPDFSTVMLDFSLLEFVDSHGMRTILSYMRRLRESGVHVEMVGAPEHLKKTLADCGFWGIGTAAPVAADTQGKLHDSLIAPPGRYLPLLRTMSEVFRTPGRDTAPIRRAGFGFVPLRAEIDAGASDRVTCKGILKHGRRTSSLFARVINAPVPGDINAVTHLVFIGAFSTPGVKAVLASSHLFAAVGAYPDFLRKRHVRHLVDYLRLLSSHLRDLVPAVSSDNEEETFMVTAIELTSEGMRTYTGIGPPLAAIGGTQLRAIPMAGSENAIMDVSDTLTPFPESGAPAAARIIIGDVAAVSRADLHECPFSDIELMLSMGDYDRDVGVLDVAFAPRIDVDEGVQ